MSASDGGHRIQYTGLVTQQRRLRHLCSLSSRNIVPDAALNGRDTLMDTYFTLHTYPSKEKIYTSEKIKNSLNPTWRSFDLQMSCPDLDASQSSILVRVWGGEGAEYNLVIEWLVHLRGLCYLGSQIHKDGVRYQPNSIIFGMFQGFYGSADNLPDASAVSRQFLTSMDVEQSSAILSYKTFSLGRLHITQRAIRQTEASVSKVRTSIEEKLSQAKHKTILCSTREELKMRLSVLTHELQSQEVRLSEDCSRCTIGRERIDVRVDELKSRCERLRSDMDDASHQAQLLLDKREQLQKVVARYKARKTTLLGELSEIYPVVEERNHEHTILGIRLPNAEHYSGTDDMVVSTGLGHTCHLILMMSEILRLPLRYPMIHYGSRSLVRDHITVTLADKDRDFPLYSRGKERFQFNYALYLMNRNIAQLRFAMSLPTADLRATLPNLKTLLELKWGIKNNSSDVIYQVPSGSIAHTGQSSAPAVMPPLAPPQSPPVYSEATHPAAVVAVESGSPFEFVGDAPMDSAVKSFGAKQLAGAKRTNVSETSGVIEVLPSSGPLQSIKVTPDQNVPPLKPLPGKTPLPAIKDACRDCAVENQEQFGKPGWEGGISEWTNSNNHPSVEGTDQESPADSFYTPPSHLPVRSAMENAKNVLGKPRSFIQFGSPKQSAPVNHLESEDSLPRTSEPPANLFEDLGSRTLALSSQQDGFSSFKKQSFNVNPEPENV